MLYRKTLTFVIGTDKQVVFTVMPGSICEHQPLGFKAIMKIRKKYKAWVGHDR